MGAWPSIHPFLEENVNRVSPADFFVKRTGAAGWWVGGRAGPDALKVGEWGRYGHRQRGGGFWIRGVIPRSVTDIMRKGNSVVAAACQK